jgi:hypothetical protein
MIFRTLSKIGLLLVILGFFMPVACNQNGFQLAEKAMQSGGDTVIVGIMLYVLFVSALAGLIIGATLLMKKQPPLALDWLTLGISVASGLFVYLKYVDSLKLQSGGYVIAVGWAIALILLIVSPTKRKTT